MADATGRTIGGKYQLVELAGEGGMATVYKGIVRGAAGFQRAIAIKHIRPEYRALKTYIDMFIEEARVGSELAHPNIVQVHAFCSDDGSYYLVMEWVEGVDLGTLIKVYAAAERQLPWATAVTIAIGALRGLGAAHTRVGPDGEPAPVIHRDVSPHNVLVGVNGIAKVSDFGLARARDRAGGLTAPGTLKGKLLYLAPEVALGGPCTVQSDLYGVGNLLWEALTGTRLIDATTEVEVFRKLRAYAVPPIAERRPDLPAELAAAIATSLAPDPAQRFATADDFAHALEDGLGRWAEGDPIARLGAAVIGVRTQVASARTRSANLGLDATDAHGAAPKVESEVMTRVKRKADP
ncbi:MAG: serine/threonine-protein kinase [Proteobacteria bacterium]|nr:serine/threonine-protein kinase [Pseudomonadota bacterium]